MKPKPLDHGPYMYASDGSRHAARPPGVPGANHAIAIESSFELAPAAGVPDPQHAEKITVWIIQLFRGRGHRRGTPAQQYAERDLTRVQLAMLQKSAAWIRAGFTHWRIRTTQCTESEFLSWHWG